MFVNEEEMMQTSKEHLVTLATYLNTMLDITSQFQTVYMNAAEQTGVVWPYIARNLRALEAEVFTCLGEVTQYIEHKKDKEEETDV